MSTRTNEAIQGALDLMYLNQNFAGIGDATGLRGSAAAGSFYMALVTDSGEAAYTGYSRQAIARGAGFTRNGNVITNVAQVTFAKSTGGSPRITKLALYPAAMGGIKLHEQILPNSFEVSENVTVPIIEAGALTITGS